MSEPQLSHGDPITGKVRGRGWSQESTWELMVGPCSAILRADDPEQPELWVEFDVSSTTLPIMASSLLSSVICSDKVHELRQSLSKLEARVLYAFCSTCGERLETKPPALWCSNQCFEVFALRNLGVEFMDKYHLLMRMRRFVSEE